MQTKQSSPSQSDSKTTGGARDRNSAPMDSPTLARAKSIEMENFNSMKQIRRPLRENKQLNNDIWDAENEKGVVRR